MAERRRKRPVVALIYDFDGTLSPHNMQEFDFIPEIGMSPEEFWSKADSIAREQDASGVLAYMKLMLDEASEHGISLTREKIRSYGNGITLYPGVETWFRRVNEYGRSKGVIVEHYVNSSGLKEMVEGTSIAREFKKIFAGSFFYNASGVAVWPAVAVDYTGKTQFLFKINKGILSVKDNVKVNESQAEELKRVPFSRMIYFGDGETDVPCMKIVKMFGGHSIAVYNESRSSQKRTAQRLLRQQRVNFTAPTDYGPDSKAYRIVCSIIDKIVADTAPKSFYIE